MNIIDRAKPLHIIDLNLPDVSLTTVIQNYVQSIGHVSGPGLRAENRTERQKRPQISRHGRSHQFFFCLSYHLSLLCFGIRHPLLICTVPSILTFHLVQTSKSCNQGSPALRARQHKACLALREEKPCIYLDIPGHLWHVTLKITHFTSLSLHQHLYLVRHQGLANRISSISWHKH